jgi:hypothetical protein
VYRLVVGCVSVIYGVIFGLDLLKDAKNFGYWLMFLLCVLWFCVTVSDCTALTNSSEACEDSFGDTNGFTCENSTWGKQLVTFLFVHNNSAV